MSAKTMKCKDLMATLSEYIDLELSPVEIDRIDQHAEECKGCHDFKETLCTTVDIIKKTSTAPPPEIHNKLMKYLKECLSAGDESF